MSNKIIGKVILTESGKVHIALNSYRSVYCTGQSLFDFFREPYEFIETRFKKYEDSTRDVYAARIEFDDIPGLTLASVYEDNRIEIFQSGLFDALYESVKNISNEHMDFMDYLYKDSFMDQKQYFIKMFLDFAGKPRSDLSISRKVPISSVFQEQLMREIFNTCISDLPRAAKELPQYNVALETVDISSDRLLDNPNSLKNFIPIAEFAKKHGVARGTVVC